ncbi:MAG: protein kinase [Chloroflexota bacterium]
MTTPEKIDRYEIREELGRGGMATVYRAFDPRFKRDVALKVLPREFNHDPMFRARFQREAETIAALEHPAIVPVYDFGEDDGLPYLVMRLMTGGSLADQIGQGAMPVADVAQILSRIGGALDRAHEMGIVHRDLKPGNILFDQYGEAYLADFGIARLAESSATLTGSGLIGTPAYMSPEQIQGAQVDGRSDIYALGIILFEMLTGYKPYQADTPAMVLVKQMTEPTPRILDVKPDLPPGCEFVIARAMAKDVTDRFEKASEVSETLSSALKGAVLPLPSPTPTQFSTPPRTVMPEVTAPASAAPEIVPAPPKRRVPVWVWGLVGLVVVAAVVGGAIWWFGDDEPDDIILLDGLEEEVDTAVATEIAAAFGAEEGSGDTITPEDAAQLMLLHRLGRGTVDSIAASPDGSLVAVGGSLGVWLYDSETLETVGLLQGHEDTVWDLAWSPDGTRLASASWDWTIRVWDVAAQTELFALRGDDQYINVAWSADGSTLAATTWYTAVELWDVERRARTDTLDALTNDAINDVAWSPQAALLAIATDGDGVFVWDVAAQAEAFHVDVPDVNCVRWSPDGSLLATCSNAETDAFQVWNGATGELVQEFAGQDYGVYDLAWAEEGAFLLSVGGDDTARLWNVAEGWEETELLEFDGTLLHVLWLPAQEGVVVAAASGTIMSFPLDGESDEMAWLDAHTDSLWSMSWSPDADYLAAAGSDGSVRVWDAWSGEATGLWEGHEYGISAVAWSPGGEYVASCGGDARVLLWDVATGQIAQEWPFRETAVVSLDWHPYEPWLAMGDYDGHVWIWDYEADVTLYDWDAHDGDVLALAWSPDGSRLATGGYDGLAQIWDVEDESLDVLELVGHEERVSDVAWSPDGELLASASHDQTARIWDAQSGAEVEVLRNHQELVSSVAWSTEEPLLATGGWDHLVRIWDTGTWREVTTLSGHNHAVIDVAWSPDGVHLASSSEDGTAIIWGLP